MDQGLNGWMLGELFIVGDETVVHVAVVVEMEAGVVEEVVV